MKYNFSLSNLACEHAGIDLQFGTLDTCGNDLGDCLLNAVVHVLDHDGNPVGHLYMSDMSDSLYAAAEQAICEAFEDAREYAE
jgi:hypothetical protein